MPLKNLAQYLIIIIICNWNLEQSHFPLLSTIYSNIPLLSTKYYLAPNETTYLSNINNIKRSQCTVDPWNQEKSKGKKRVTVHPTLYMAQIDGRPGISIDLPSVAICLHGVLGLSQSQRRVFSSISGFQQESEINWTGLT